MADKIVFRDGRLHIEGEAHTQLQALLGEHERLKGALESKLSGPAEALGKELEAIAGFDQKAFIPVLKKITLGEVKAADVTAGPLRTAAEKVEAFVQKNATAEHGAFVEFQKRTGGSRKIAELAATQKQLIAEARGDLTKIEGYTPQLAKKLPHKLSGLEKEVEKISAEHAFTSPKEAAALAKPPAEAAKAEANAGEAAATEGKAVAKETAKDAEGFWASQFSKLKRNFGAEAWKEMPWKTGFRTGGTVVGLGMVADATFRSTARDGSGGETERSAAARMLEGGGGGVLALISALVGSRGK